MPYLSINTEGQPSYRRPLDGPTIVGRSRDADISIRDHRLSRQHCRFEKTAQGDWIVTDLNSTNGTIVLGERISVHRLEDGEALYAGRTRIVFHARSAPPERPQAPTRSIEPSDSRVGAPSPGDTLIDSKFRMPRIDPASAGVHKSASRSDKKERRTPLPFQRPPAQPIVPGGAPSQRREGFLRSLWRRIMRR